MAARTTRYILHTSPLVMERPDRAGNLGACVKMLRSGKLNRPINDDKEGRHGRQRQFGKFPEDRKNRDRYNLNWEVRGPLQSERLDEPRPADWLANNGRRPHQGK